MSSLGVDSFETCFSGSKSTPKPTTLPRNCITGVKILVFIQRFPHIELSLIISKI